ncbi:MAG: hypothetical protein KDD83_12420, partial [Caldilineaceae bacterium]|nr:hypothetical protein [Caldilineaceae bacterium]
MAIAVVDEGWVAGTADGTTITWPISVSGGDILIIAAPLTRANSSASFASPWTATYNGSAMTVEGFFGGSSSTNRWYGNGFAYILSPATGTH